MKITLEFEDDDLRNMIANHFTNEGFLVKNLDEICSAFGVAFPQGLRVEAEVAPVPATTKRYVGKRGVALEDAEEHDNDYVADPEFGSAPLTMGDLMDPTPRRGRLEAARKSVKPDKAITGIERLIKESRALEQET